MLHYVYNLYNYLLTDCYFLRYCIFMNNIFNFFITYILYICHNILNFLKIFNKILIPSVYNFLNIVKLQFKYKNIISKIRNLICMHILYSFSSLKGQMRHNIFSFCFIIYNKIFYDNIFDSYLFSIFNKIKYYRVIFINFLRNLRHNMKLSSQRQLSFGHT